MHFDVSSSYDSFQLAVDRRIGEGFAFGSNYTYAKCIDDVSNEFGGGALNGGAIVQYTGDVHSSRGPCAFIAEHHDNARFRRARPDGRDRLAARRLAVEHDHDDSEWRALRSVARLPQLPSGRPRRRP